ncbi:MAG: phage head-tail connector protein [Clostridiales bacterium]|nr:phage head-tail connector protein [Clostridiales bacterium]
MSEYLDKLKRRLRITDTEQDALLADLITDAQAFAMGYTGRDPLPDAAEGAIIELAAMSFGRLGIEGQAAHAEGRISIRVDGLPAMLKAQLDSYRVAKVG